MKSSLRDEAFGEIIEEADDILNQALRIAVSSGSSFDLVTKIRFQNTRRGNFAIIGESGYKFEAVADKNKFELTDEIIVSLDDDGNPKVESGANQMKFGEVR